MLTPCQFQSVRGALPARNHQKPATNHARLGTSQEPVPSASLGPVPDQSSPKPVQNQSGIVLVSFGGGQEVVTEWFRGGSKVLASMSIAVDSRLVGAENLEQLRLSVESAKIEQL